MFGTAVDVGFAVGKGPSVTIVQWVGGLTIIGVIAVAKGANVALPVAIKLLPDPDYPRGFGVGLFFKKSTPEPTESISLAEESAEDHLTNHLTKTVRGMNSIDFEDTAQTERLLSALETGADGMAGRVQSTACTDKCPDAVPDCVMVPLPPTSLCAHSLVVMAAVGVDFCVTCGIVHGGEQGIIGGPGENTLSASSD